MTGQDGHEVGRWLTYRDELRAETARYRQAVAAGREDHVSVIALRNAEGAERMAWLAIPYAERPADRWGDQDAEGGVGVVTVVAGECPAWCSSDEGFDPIGDGRLERAHESDGLYQAAGVSVSLSCEDTLSTGGGCVRLVRGASVVLVRGPADTFRLSATDARQLADALRDAAAMLDGER